MDMCDAETYGWNYVPLYNTCDCIDASKRLYDISFIGSMHTKRAVIAKKLKEFQKRNPEMNIFTYVRIPFLSYIKQKYILRNKDYADVTRKTLRFRKMAWDETQKIYENTRIMVDYTAPGQNGYTTRTIECLACKCKLVTNNANVKEADFYRSNNIWVYEENSFDIPEWFLNADYQELPPEIYQRYTIAQWIRNVLSD